MAVGWYLRFSLSYRDVEELLIERGLDADHVTVWRWVQRYAPELERRLRAHLKSTNKSWGVDETFVRVKGKWAYLYRAVDSTGATIDFLFSAQRDTAAAKRFFKKSITFTWPSHSPRHQRRSMSVLPASGETAKEGRATASPLSTEAGAIFEQYFGTGSPGHKTTNKSQPRLPFILGRLANDRWLRGSEHDQEGTGKMGRQGVKSSSNSASLPPCSASPDDR